MLVESVFLSIWIAVSGHSEIFAAPITRQRKNSHSLLALVATACSDESVAFFESTNIQEDRCLSMFRKKSVTAEEFHKCPSLKSEIRSIKFSASLRLL